MEQWRTLLYPLGFLSAFTFGARFIVQWMESEKRGESIVTPLFWRLSLLGNALLAIHSFIQVQFHVCLIQTLSAAISWRNLNLMQKKAPPLPFRKVLALLCISPILVILAFMIQGSLILEEGEKWLRMPLAPWQMQNIQISPVWHFFGTLGYALFSSRFWIQWWSAEKQKKSYLPLPFWWLSLSGAILSCLYFMHIRDLVNIIGPLMGLIPYTRNLLLIYKVKKLSGI